VEALRQLEATALLEQGEIGDRYEVRVERISVHEPAVREKVATAPSPRPLVVDLDGTLVASDLLIETAFAELGRKPQNALEVARALSRGKAALKHRLAAPAVFDAALLPYDPAVLDAIHNARAAGRPVYLASASNRRLVEAVAEHLRLFTGWFASDEATNLAGAAKADQLVEAFGEHGFDYIGNDAADFPVWEKAARAIAIRTSGGVARRIARSGLKVEHLEHRRPTWRTWAKLLRVHQYAKNALVFVPLVTSHLFTPEAYGAALLAFLAFSLCASSVYIVNDLVDLQDDRGHRTKCNRPLACGAIPLIHAVLAAPLLFLAAIALASTISWAFLGVLLGYFALTTAYSFALKRMMLIDVITLAGLYSVRVIGGAVAVDVVVSKWLLGFCLMIFVALALIKRYVELAARRDAGQADPTSRDYKLSDLDMVAALAAAAGFNAVTVFALYISSTAVNGLYTRPEALWFVCPLLIYWIARALMLASRREMDDDPVVFALKDRTSLVTIGLAGAVILAAI
jgi:4-hydroxybenzoate polyprenyltransferase/phosphoserine phosphatase